MNKFNETSKLETELKQKLEAAEEARKETETRMKELSMTTEAEVSERETMNEQVLDLENRNGNLTQKFKDT